MTIKSYKQLTFILFHVLVEMAYVVRICMARHSPGSHMLASCWSLLWLTWWLTRWGRTCSGGGFRHRVQTVL